jgi:hypothetical protein
MDTDLTSKTRSWWGLAKKLKYFFEAGTGEINDDDDDDDDDKV